MSIKFMMGVPVFTGTWNIVRILCCDENLEEPLSQKSDTSLPKWLSETNKTWCCRWWYDVAS